MIIKKYDQQITWLSFHQLLFWYKGWNDFFCQVVHHHQNIIMKIERWKNWYEIHGDEGIKNG
jgi:hypothetical protein